MAAVLTSLTALALGNAPVGHAQDTTRITVSGTRPVNDILSVLTGSMTQAQWYAYGPRIGENWAPGTTPTNVDYPATLGRLNSRASLDDSVATGQARLDTAIMDTPGPVVVTGLSQGTLVQDAEIAKLAADPNAPDASRLRFVEFGNPMRGVFSRLPEGTRIPIVGLTITTPVDSQYDIDVVRGEYDGWTDFPDRPLNLLADANALMGMRYVHTPSALSYPDTAVVLDSTTDSRGGTITTYLVPTAHLPLTQPLRPVLGDPAVDRIDSVLRPIIDHGYERNDPPAVTTRRPASTSKHRTSTASQHRAVAHSGRRR